MTIIMTGGKIQLNETTTIEFFQEDQTDSPREWDNQGIFVNYHPKYLIGDKNVSRDDYPCAVQFLESERLQVKDVIMLPVYMYDHSGITINTVGFHCSWDSDRIGFIYMTKEAVRKEWQVQRISKKLRETVLSNLKGEIETLDQFITGEVYWFAIEKSTPCNSCGSDNTEVTDSCGGFYGSDIKTNGMLEHIDKEYHEALLENLS